MAIKFSNVVDSNGNPSSAPLYTVKVPGDYVKDYKNGYQSSDNVSGSGAISVPDNKSASTITDAVTNPVKYVYLPYEGNSSADEGFQNLIDSFQNLKDELYDLNEKNNARMVENAERQMKFQEQSQAKAMQFNAEQAKLDRDWQEYMSNTAHQREVTDLISAGLNPVLSANGGAAVGSGSSASAQAMQGSQADTDTSISNFFGNLAGAYASMHNAEVSAKAALGSANINAAAMQAVANINRQSNMDITRMTLPANVISSIFGSIMHFAGMRNFKR